MARNGLFFLLPVTCYLSLSFSGCATSYNPATERQEAIFIGTEREILMGESISKKVEEEYELVGDPKLLERLDQVGSKVSAVADRRDLVYRFSIIEEKEPNAFALPGGIIYVSRGLMELVQSDDELASVLAHEVGHVTAKHVVKRIQGAIGLELVQLLVLGTGAVDPKTRAGMNLAFASILTAYSQQDELEADSLAVRYLKEAGYQPLAAISFLERLRDYTMKQPSRRFFYFRTHPYFADRIRVVREKATGSIQFDDYINLQEN